MSANVMSRERVAELWLWAAANVGTPLPEALNAMTAYASVGCVRRPMKSAIANGNHSTVPIRATRGATGLLATW